MGTRVLYVTGTDTGIGKTWAAAALLRGLRAAGARALPMKPVASGCELRDGGRVNDDALALIAACGERPDYDMVNPYALLAPVSPHIAAAEEGVRIELARIQAAASALAARCEVLVVEGAGGWLSPVDAGLWQSDIARALGAEVLLVVGLRLGCINHALLSARAIAADGLKLAGWIGNRIDPALLAAEAVIETLREALPAPCLGVLPWGDDSGGDALDPAAIANLSS
jgi:dethiobiotin synthetase